jgi:tyrosyl-tRNA synthetase
LKVDDETCSDAGRMFTAADLGAPVKLSAGKKRHALVSLG